MVIKICKECGKGIDLKTDRHVLLGTYNGEDIMDESYFHLNCFVKWYNKRVAEKAKNTTREMQSKVQGLMKNPQIAGLMGMIGGTDKLKGMLNTDLNADVQSIDINKMMADLMPDEKDNNNQDGKPKRKPKPKPKTTKKKVQ